MTRLDAVGAHIYAGGHSLGARAAGFRVLAHLEEGAFGTETVRLNMPEIDLRVGAGRWDVPALRGRVDWLYGNPPCASWSNAGKSATDSRNYETDVRTQCTERLFALVPEIEPTVFSWECVAAATVRGEAFVAECVEYLRSLGYGVTGLVFDGADVGLPQTRKRFFLVGHRVAFEPEEPGYRRVTVREALAGVDPGVEHPTPPAMVAVLKKAPLGVYSCLRNVHDAAGGEKPGRPSFVHDRCGWDQPAPTSTGSGNLYHPDLPRRLTVAETKAVCGYPAGYEFVGSAGKQYAQISQAVLPPPAAWLGRAVRRAIERGEPIDASAPPRLHNFIRSGRRYATSWGGDDVVKCPKEETMTATEAAPRAAQPKASRRERTAGRYDTSQLTEQNRGNYVHRDYAAHFFRWGWSRRFVRCGETRVLDAGCGRDAPLARVMNAPGQYPKGYVGVDYQAVDRAPGFAWCEAIGDFDFASRWPEVAEAQRAEAGGLFDLVVSFEVVEHMAKEDGLRFIAGLRGCLADGGTLLLSTPVFNGRAAAAHLHEWRADELRGALEGAGLEVVRRYGTFASYPDMKRAAAPGDLAVLERLREFYSDDVAACFLAPMYPDASRNCAWVCRPAAR